MSESEEKSSPQGLKVLIVDNDRDHAQVILEALDRVGYDCVATFSGPEGAERLAKEHFDIIITDLVMPEIDGMGILKRAKENLPEADVIVVTGHASVPKAVEAMQQGAANFLEKPLNIGRLRAVAEKSSEAIRLRRENVQLAQRLDERYGYEGIIYVSHKMQQVVDQLKRIAPTDATVMITGPHGSGKELVANALHQNSPRKKRPFVALNCAALQKELVEDELFGHVKGAYTSGDRDREGKFEYAHGGTIFLDEIGDMPLSTQAKLLRVLEERKVTRLGSNQPIPIDVRVVSATNRNLEEAIKKGEFREDLYFRLKVLRIHLPGLVERKDDIAPLADHFRKELAKRYNKKVRGITQTVMRRFYEYDWPGSVRDLRTAIETMVVLDTDGVLDVDDLPPELSREDDVPGDHSALEAPPSPPAGQPTTAAGPEELIGKPMSEIEKWAIANTLKLNDQNREETAKMLGIGSRTLYRKIKEYNL